MWPLSYPTTRSTFLILVDPFHKEAASFLKPRGAVGFIDSIPIRKNRQRTPLEAIVDITAYSQFLGLPNRRFCFFFSGSEMMTVLPFFGDVDMIPFFFLQIDHPNGSHSCRQERNISQYIFGQDFHIQCFWASFQPLKTHSSYPPIRTLRLLKALIAIGQPVQFYVAIDTWDSNDTRRHVLYVSNTSDSRSAEIYGWYCLKSHGCFFLKDCSSLLQTYELPMNLTYSVVGNMCFHVPIIEGKTSSFMRSWSFFLWRRVALWFSEPWIYI